MEQETQSEADFLEHLVGDCLLAAAQLLRCLFYPVVERGDVHFRQFPDVFAQYFKMQRFFFQPVAFTFRALGYRHELFCPAADFFRARLFKPAPDHFEQAFIREVVGIAFAVAELDFQFGPAAVKDGIHSFLGNIAQRRRKIEAILFGNSPQLFEREIIPYFA